MGNEVAKCSACGKTITAEEITAGQSLTCPVCEDKPAEKAKDEKKPAAETDAKR